MIRTTRSVLAAVVLVLGAGEARAQNLAPSPLLAIEQNRTTVVERIVRDWGAAVAGSNAGISIEQLRKLLQGLRSDYLFAASLTGSVEGLRTVVANGITAEGPVRAGLARTKSLGDATADLTYTPVTPCRIADTRIAGGPLGTNSARDFKVFVTSGGFTAQGGDAGSCNVPPNPAAVVLNVTAVNPQGLGNLIGYPTGAALPNTSVLNYQPGTFALSNGAVLPACIPNCANQVTVKTNGAGTDVVLDVVGYFKSPGDATSLDIKVAGARVMRFEYTPLPFDATSPNVIAGDGTSNVTAGVYGAAIGGGGISGTQISLPLAIVNCLGDAGSCANRVTDTFGTVAGGAGNQAGDGSGTIGSAPFATVGGGLANTASNWYSTIAGGVYNDASGSYSTVAGGYSNAATGSASTVAGGDGNAARGGSSTVAGGISNAATGSASTVAGGSLNAAGAAGSSVGGGTWNTAGYAGNGFSTVAGGAFNDANGQSSAVAGGDHNIAAGSNSTVGGGSYNVASGFSSTVAGGQRNTASGAYSLAAGRRANTQTFDPPAVHDGTFVWADSNDFDFTSSASNEFSVRATGGVRFVLGIDGTGAPTWTCSATNGSGWACSSDRNLKENLLPVDGAVVLQRLAALPLYFWNAKSADPTVSHLGPMAQDFMAAFRLGDNNKMIGFADAQGVAFAAIQGLNAKLEAQVADKDREIAELRARVAAAETSSDALRGRVADLESLSAEMAALKAALAELREPRTAVAAH